MSTCRELTDISAPPSAGDSLLTGYLTAEAPSDGLILPIHAGKKENANIINEKMSTIVSDIPLVLPHLYLIYLSFKMVVSEFLLMSRYSSLQTQPGRFST